MKKIIKYILYLVYEKRLAKKLLIGPAPKHLGVILDGNRRYAKSLGLPVAEGHRLREMLGRLQSGEQLTMTIVRQGRLHELSMTVP